jgi:hypothetical protein
LCSKACASSGSPTNWKLILFWRICCDAVSDIRERENPNEIREAAERAKLHCEDPPPTAQSQHSEILNWRTTKLTRGSDASAVYRANMLHTITAQGHDSFKNQLRPWQNNPEFVIENEDEIAELLTILLHLDRQWNEKNIKPIGWEIFCNVHYHPLGSL